MCGAPNVARVVAQESSPQQAADGGWDTHVEASQKNSHFLLAQHTPSDRTPVPYIPMGDHTAIRGDVKSAGYRKRGSAKPHWRP